MSKNRQETDKPKRPAPKTAFKKGVSGNPGGRPKRTAEELDLIAACKDRTPAALAVIESIMMEGENERNRLAAAQAIIDRGYGKAPEKVEHTGKGGGPIQHTFKLTPLIA
ncbi:DUF5681 domain-containing protein [Burkholderia sp. NRF60-BP8]|uniref:DUF5681 domain-containing protein n=1 Tax=Burkholderia sp. NRF60-BP8 TaxID=1637853 RepID=UPI0009E7ED7B|nr:DUF5681 domain-containing protein [Burkholderia sp. NRF60-BP8]